MQKKILNGILDMVKVYHHCTINYDGISGDIELDGLLLLVLELEQKVKE